MSELAVPAAILGMLIMGLLGLALQQLAKVWPLWVDHEHNKKYVKRQLYNYTNVQLMSAERVIADLRIALAKEHAMRYADATQHSRAMTELRKEIPRYQDIPHFIAPVIPFKKIN